MLAATQILAQKAIVVMNAVRGFAQKPIGDFSDYAATCIDDAIKKVFG